MALDRPSPCLKARSRGLRRLGIAADVSQCRRRGAQVAVWHRPPVLREARLCNRSPNRAFRTAAVEARAPGDSKAARGGAVLAAPCQHARRTSGADQGRGIAADERVLGEFPNGRPRPGVEVERVADKAGGGCRHHPQGVPLPLCTVERAAREGPLPGKPAGEQPHCQGADSPAERSVLLGRSAGRSFCIGCLRGLFPRRPLLRRRQSRPPVQLTGPLRIPLPRAEQAGVLHRHRAGRPGQALGAEATDPHAAPPEVHQRSEEGVEPVGDGLLLAHRAGRANVRLPRPLRQQVNAVRVLKGAIESQEAVVVQLGKHRGVAVEHLKLLVGKLFFLEYPEVDLEARPRADSLVHGRAAAHVGAGHDLKVSQGPITPRQDPRQHNREPQDGQPITVACTWGVHS
mmetsp:Transcript_36010/g.85419  ORF Transcript_36010/g.85419 Transcript_36010/m.85419 type:complete len:401 (-) Transcript_36010:646-1848(-)